MRQYGRSEVTLGGKEAAILSRHLLDFVATLWRQWNTEPPRQAPVVAMLDLSNGEFSASDYKGSIAAGEHSSSDIAVALSEIPSARTDGLLVLLDVCKRKDDGAVFKLHFQRDVRDRLEDATCNFCGVLFTVQKLPRSTWSILRCRQSAMRSSSYSADATCSFPTARAQASLSSSCLDTRPPSSRTS